MGDEKRLVNAYQILNISEDATDIEIRSAYRKKAHDFHPDQGGTVEQFLTLQKAQTLLSNAALRQKMGKELLFKPLPLRIRPSMSSATSTLFQNLHQLKNQLNLGESR